jgi:hypothetical protein
MGKAGYARSGKGSTPVSKSGVARSGNMTLSKALPGSMVEPKAESVPSNIPGSAAQGVPDANGSDEGNLARAGNENMQSTVVQMSRGQVSYGRAVAGWVARTGGQVGLSPNQIGAWSQKATK